MTVCVYFNVSHDEFQSHLVITCTKRFLVAQRRKDAPFRTCVPFYLKMLFEIPIEASILANIRNNRSAILVNYNEALKPMATKLRHQCYGSLPNTKSKMQYLPRVLGSKDKEICN